MHQPGQLHQIHQLTAIIAPYISGGRAISSIIIDGYNLIGIRHRDLQKKREELIQQLIAYRKRKGHDITVVFDGWKSGGHKQEEGVTGGIRVIYSRLGDKADRVIKKMIEQDRKEWIVITSDREIMAHAWSFDSVPVDSAQFMHILEDAGSITSGEYELLEEDDHTPPRKGSSQRLSKKEKAFRRALRKL